MNKGGQVIIPILPNEPIIERSEIPTLRRDKAKISRIPLWQEMQNKAKLLRFQHKYKDCLKNKPISWVLGSFYCRFTKRSQLEMPAMKKHKIEQPVPTEGEAKSRPRVGTNPNCHLRDLSLPTGDLSQPKGESVPKYMIWQNKAKLLRFQPKNNDTSKNKPKSNPIDRLDLSFRPPSRNPA
jgi:hypothetical protein